MRSLSVQTLPEQAAGLASGQAELALQLLCMHAGSRDQSR